MTMSESGDIFTHPDPDELMPLGVTIQGEQDDSELNAYGSLESSTTALISSEPPRYQTKWKRRYRKLKVANSAQSTEREASYEVQRNKAKETKRSRKLARQSQEQLRTEEQQERQVLIGSESDSDASSVDENYDIDSLAESVDEKFTYRDCLRSALKSRWFHLIIVILVVFDAFIVLFELLLDFGAFENIRCQGGDEFEQAKFCHYYYPKMCPPSGKMVLLKINITSFNSSKDICSCGYKGGRTVCLAGDDATEIKPGLVLHLASVCIVSLFLVEVVLKMIVFRLKHFTKKIEVFDALVIVLSWILDIASLVKKEAFAAVGLLIVLRLWRIIRIAHAWFDVNYSINTCSGHSHTTENLLQESRAESRKIIHALHKAQNKMDELKGENIRLRRDLKAAHAASSQLSKSQEADYEYNENSLYYD